MSHQEGYKKCTCTCNFSINKKNMDKVNLYKNAYCVYCLEETYNKELKYLKEELNYWIIENKEYPAPYKSTKIESLQKEIDDLHSLYVSGTGAGKDT